MSDTTKTISWIALGLAVLALVFSFAGKTVLAPLGSVSDATFGPRNTTTTSLQVGRDTNIVALLNNGRAFISICNQGSSTVWLGFDIATGTAVTAVASGTGFPLYGASTSLAQVGNNANLLGGVSQSCFQQSYPTIYVGRISGSSNQSTTVSVLEGARF